MIKNLFHLYQRRYMIKKERIVEGICRTCGNPTKCEPWCWGPFFWQHVWIGIKSHNISIMLFLWKNYKNNLKWAGVEPYHRYE